MTSQKIDRTTRAAETRQKTERKKSWVRPSDLDAPEAPPGYRHRWIRVQAGGHDDSKMMRMMKMSGLTLESVHMQSRLMLDLIRCRPGPGLD